MWYYNSPKEYANWLRFGAEGSDASAARREAEGKPWSAREAELFRRQARRLRAMAMLCERSTAARAGDIDFRRLHDPTLSDDESDETVSQIEKEG